MPCGDGKDRGATLGGGRPARGCQGETAVRQTGRGDPGGRDWTAVRLPLTGVPLRGLLGVPEPGQEVGSQLVSGPVGDALSPPGSKGDALSPLGSGGDRQLLLKSRELHLAGAPHGCRELVADDSGSGSMVFMPGSRPPTREGLGVAGQVSEPIAAGPSGARGCPVLLRGSLRGLQRRQEPRTSACVSSPVTRAHRPWVVTAGGRGGAYLLPPLSVLAAGL